MSKYSIKLYKDAIEDFNVASDKEYKQMDQDPSITERNAGIENGLAQCYHALQDYEKAMDYYQMAIDGEK